MRLFYRIVDNPNGGGCFIQRRVWFKWVNISDMPCFGYMEAMHTLSCLLNKRGREVKEILVRALDPPVKTDGLTPEPLDDCIACDSVRYQMKEDRSVDISFFNGDFWESFK